MAPAPRITATLETIHVRAGAVLAGLAEKVLWTYLQALAAILLAGTVLDVSTAQAAAMAALPAALTVVANGLPIVPEGLRFGVDLVLRSVRTYAVSFLGFLLALPVFSLDYSVLAAASTAALPAVLALIKATAASHLGTTGTAATLPASLDVHAALPLT